MSNDSPDGNLVPLLWENTDTSQTNQYIYSASDKKLPLSFYALERKEKLNIPQHNELHVVRHFTRLAKLNFSIDSQMYPLGSCTMKYNPRVNDYLAAHPRFGMAHPSLNAPGSFELLYRLQQALKELSGFDGVSLMPAAGAQGELCGLLMIRQYHELGGERERRVVLVPDTAHGTNPASVAMCGMEVRTVDSNKNGQTDLAHLKSLLNENIAGMMLTNPNTLGIFEEDIVEICRLVHEAGGLMYGDGANFNAIAGIVRPAELGFDIMHFNLHKTFGTPHGGGGPGAGPVGCTGPLSDFLPGPIIVKEGEQYVPYHPKKSIGRIKTGFGNFGILLRAYAYIIGHGSNGLRRNSEMAVLKANYLRKLLEKELPAFFSTKCMHEFVATNPLKNGVRTMDIAKALLDHGFHSPTVYFPLTVKEALMIEPTESESFEEIEAFASALKQILATTESETLQQTPMTTVVGRLDEVKANRNLILRHRLANKNDG